MIKIAKIATIAAGLALLAGQPAAVMAANPGLGTITAPAHEGGFGGGGGGGGRDNKGSKVLLSLAALTAFLLGLYAITHGGGGGDTPRPTSP